MTMGGDVRYLSAGLHEKWHFATLSVTHSEQQTIIWTALFVKDVKKTKTKTYYEVASHDK